MSPSFSAASVTQALTACCWSDPRTASRRQRRNRLVPAGHQPGQTLSMGSGDLSAHRRHLQRRSERCGHRRRATCPGRRAGGRNNAAGVLVGRGSTRSGARRIPFRPDTTGCHPRAGARSIGCIAARRMTKSIKRGFAVRKTRHVRILSLVVIAGTAAFVGKPSRRQSSGHRIRHSRRRRPPPAGISMKNNAYRATART